MNLASLLGMDAMAPTNALGIQHAPGTGYQFDLPAAAMPQTQPMHQPSKFRNFLGAIGDALLVSHGMQPMYRQAQQERQLNSALQGFLTNPDAAIASVMQIDPMTGIKLYQMQHPKAETPAIVGELQAAGIDPTSEEGRAIIKNHLSSSGGAPSSVEEYNFAKANGFSGSYMDFLNQRGGPLIANNGDGTFTIVPRNMVGGGAPAPTPGEVTATNPKTGEKVRYNPQTHSWEPMGGATASAPSPTFR